MMAKEAASDDSGLQSGHSLFQVLGCQDPFRSRRTPASGLLRARVAAEAGKVNTPLPHGVLAQVYNLLQSDGPTDGSRIQSHGRQPKVEKYNLDSFSHGLAEDSTPD